MTSSSVSAVTVKRIDPVRILGLREQIDSFQEQGRLWNTLTTFIADQNTPKAGPGFAVHYNLGSVVGQEGRIDVEVCIPVADEYELPEDHGVDGLSLHELPALERAASVTLQGACTGLPSAYTALFSWMKQTEATQNGPSREIYLTYDLDPMSDDYRCEVVVPLT